MRIIPLFFLIITAFTSRVNAYPIKPKFLRQLVSESKFIIVGHVVSIRGNEEESEELGSNIAKILVLENLQGNVNKDTVEIDFNPNLVCPGTDKYFEGTNFIGFLERGENGRFFAPDLKYGVKNSSKKEIEVYKKRIFEIQEISKADDKEKQLEGIFEWLIRCSENEATSFEGTAELTENSEFMLKFLSYKKLTYEQIINKKAKDRLKQALFQTQKNVNFSLVNLIYKGNERQIDDFLVSRLKSINSEYWNAYNYMYVLKVNRSSVELENIWRAYESLYFNSKNEHELGMVVKKFIETLEKS